MTTPRFLALSVVLAAAVGAVGGITWQRHVAPPRPAARAFRSMPTVHAIPAPVEGAPRGRVDLAAIQAELAAAAASGCWQLDKHWENVINALGPTEVHALVAQIDQLGAKATLGRLREILFNRWGECDPAAALAEVERVTARGERDALREQVLRGWVYSDPDGFLGWLNRQPAGPTRRFALNLALDQLAGTRPQATFALLRAAGDMRVEQCYPVLFRAWAAQDPQAAAQQARLLPAGHLHDRALAAVASAWAERDPAAALAFAQEVRASGQPSNMFNTIFERWGQRDAAAALAAARQLPEEFRGAMAGLVIGQLARQDPEAALGAVRDLRSGCDRTHALQAIVTALVDDDASLAATFVAALPPSPAQVEQMRRVAGALAADDATAALTWVRGLPEGSGRAAALHSVIESLASTAPQVALGIVDTLPAATQPRAVEMVLENWSAQDFPAALAWAQQLPEGDARARALQQLAPRWAHFDPEAALAFVTTGSGPRNPFFLEQIGRNFAGRDAAAIDAAAGRLPADGRSAFLNGVVATTAQRSPSDAARLIAALNVAPSGSYDRVAQQWAALDPAAAAAWAGGLPAGAPRNASLAAIARTWASSDAGAAAQWIGTLPWGATRDAAARAYVENVGDQLPEFAAGVSSTIGDERTRTNAMQHVAEAWLQTNRPAAEAWIAQSTLSEAVKRDLLQRRPGI